MLTHIVVVLNNVKPILPSKRGITSRWRKRERIPAEEQDLNEQHDVENIAFDFESQNSGGYHSIRG